MLTTFIVWLNLFVLLVIFIAWDFVLLMLLMWVLLRCVVCLCGNWLFVLLFDLFAVGCLLLVLLVFSFAYDVYYGYCVILFGDGL